MKYSKEFRELVDKFRQTYIGTGNPDSKILFIGKECAIDPVDEEQYRREIAGNAADWSRNIDQNIDAEQVVNWMSSGNPRYNPLYPYKGQAFKKRSVTKKGVRGDGGTSATWYNYQKIMNRIMGVSDQHISFHEHSFMTELNDVTGRYSSHISDEDKRKSIEKRSALLKSMFFQQFPVVIVACGNYQRKYNIDLEDIFNVKWMGRIDKVGEKWLSMHYQAAGTPKLLIHTNQLSMNISDELINKIAEVCLDFMKENKIEV